VIALSFDLPFAYPFSGTELRAPVSQPRARRVRNSTPLLALLGSASHQFTATMQTIKGQQPMRQELSLSSHLDDHQRAYAQTNSQVPYTARGDFRHCLSIDVEVSSPAPDGTPRRG
jgi:hypothetical protein